MLRKLSIIAVAVSALVLSGCGGSGNGSIIKPEIMFVNASPDSGAISYRLNDEVEAAGLGYSANTPGFAEFDFEGPDVDGYDVSVHGPTGTELARQAIVFNQNSDNVVIAHGLVNFPAGEELKRFRFTSFTVDRQRPVGSKSRLIVVHALERSTGNSTPAIRFQNPGDIPQFQTGGIQSGATASLVVDSGPSTWIAKREGADGIFATANLNFVAGGVYLIIVSGIEGDPLPANQPKITVVSLPTVL